MVDHYLEALPLAAGARAALLHNVDIIAGDDDAVALAKLHRTLVWLNPAQTTLLGADTPAYTSVGLRLDTAYGAARASAASTEPSVEPAPLLERDSQGCIHLDTGLTPARRSMVLWSWVLGSI